MHEQRPEEHAGRRIVADHEPLELLEKCAAASRERRSGRPRLRARGRTDVPHAFGRRGVSREEAGTVGIVPGQRLLTLEGVKEGRQGRGVPARAGREGDAALIGVALLVTAVGRQDHPRRQLARAADDTAERRAHRAEYPRRNPEEQRERRRGAGPARGVPLQHVSHLVTEDSGQLVLAVEEGDQSARDVNVASGERERVRLDVVGHVEPPGHVGALRDLRHPAGDLPHIAHELGIAEQADRPLDLLRGLCPELALLAGRDRRAATREDGQGRDETAAESPACESDWCGVDGRVLPVVKPVVVVDWHSTAGGTRRGRPRSIRPENDMEE